MKWNKLTPEIIQEALKLKNKGWSFFQLAKRYSCDHTSLIYRFKKLGFNYMKYGKKEKVKTFIKKSKTYIKKIEQKPVKKYADYLKEKKEKENPDPIEKAKLSTK